MKALRPEIAKLKEKLGNDQQAMSMDQMKLFREAGVNPLGDVFRLCCRYLYSLPCLVSLIRKWASGSRVSLGNDLSAFDDAIKFGVNIPLLGSHLSLFNITAVYHQFPYFLCTV